MWGSEPLQVSLAQPEHPASYPRAARGAQNAYKGWTICSHRMGCCTPQRTPGTLSSLGMWFSPGTSRAGSVWTENLLATEAADYTAQRKHHFSYRELPSLLPPPYIIPKEETWRSGQKASYQSRPSLLRCTPLLLHFPRPGVGLHHSSYQRLLRVCVLRPPIHFLVTHQGHISRDTADFLCPTGAVEGPSQEFRGRGFCSHHLSQKKRGRWPLLDLR